VTPSVVAPGDTNPSDATVCTADVNKTNEDDDSSLTPKHSACLITMLCMLSLIDSSTIVYNICFCTSLFAGTVSYIIIFSVHAKKTNMQKNMPINVSVQTFSLFYVCIIGVARPFLKFKTAK